MTPETSESPAQALKPGQRLVREIPIDQLSRNPLQPREYFDAEALDELAASIKVQGILQPILVRPDGPKYEVLVGERRWRAAQQAGLKTVPAIVRDVDDRQAQEWALLENLQREDLNPIEEARAYQTLIREYSLNQEEVAERVGKDRASVANAVRLLNLPKPYIDDVISGALSAGHARVLLSLVHEAQRKSLRNRIVKRGLSVRETERLARVEKDAGPRRLRAGESVIDPELRRLRDLLEDRLKTRVAVKPKSKSSGKVEILYSSIADFGRILEAMGVTEEQ